MMQYAMECSSGSFLPRHKEMTAWNAMQHCVMPFLATTQRTLPCNATMCHFLATAQRGLLQHEGQCCSMKDNAMAHNTTLQHVAQCHGRKNMVVAQKALLWHKHNAQQKKHCCSTKCNATAQRYGHGTNTKHQHCQFECFLFEY